MYTDDIWGRTGPHTHVNITDESKAAPHPVGR